ncbi:MULTISPECIES: zinc ribbon domain-containing protein [Bacteroidales]
MEQKICQSCGMPLKKDPNLGGTNADGTLSKLYCSFCYQNGAFTDNCTDVKEFQEKCRRIMISHGHSRFTAWLFTRGMKRLSRWEK